MILLLGLAVCAASVPAAEDGPSPAADLRALQRGLKDLEDEIDRAYAAAKTDSERHDIMVQLHARGSAFYERAVALAVANPDDPAALDALVWVATGLLDVTPETGPAIERAFSLLAERHAASPRLGLPVCKASIRFDGFLPAPRTFLRAVLERHPSPEVRGHACFWLARGLHGEALTAQKLRDPLVGKSVEAYLAGEGAGVLARFQRDDPAALDREAESLFERAAGEFGGIKLNDTTTLGEAARGKLFQMRHLAPGRVAPELEGQDLDGRPLKLSAHRGQVVVITFWATGCAPCMALVRNEVSLAERMRGRPLVLLGVNYDEKADAARQAVSRLGISWRSWWDQGPRGQIALRWGVDSWPTVYVLDHKGVVRYHQPGRQMLDKVVEHLVAQAEKDAR
jgi:thiol-disulfide isomerase/thioredoxin